MTRKPALIIPLILLLLIGGGGVAFYLHLRMQAPPEFSEVDQFLRQFPVPPDWHHGKIGEHSAKVSAGFQWLEKFGIDRSKEIPITSYTIAIPPAETLVVVHVTHDSERIADVWIIADTDDEKEIIRLLSERFSRLQPLLRTHFETCR